ncbi:TUBA1B isoform 2, partial [Pan troglodytes]
MRRRGAQERAPGIAHSSCAAEPRPLSLRTDISSALVWPRASCARSCPEMW